MSDKPQKVFCVGFQKTGTTSLGVALERLGYRTCGYAPFRPLADPSAFSVETLKSQVFELAEQYDAFKDTPWPLFYKELDKRHPNSKFILVVRDTNKWIKSATTDFKGDYNAIHNYIYGCGAPLNNEDAFIKRYMQHNQEVTEYFSGRSDQFISLQMDKGEVNWDNLCTFLGAPVPDIDWPHSNTARSKQMRMFLKKFTRKLGL